MKEKIIVCLVLLSCFTFSCDSKKIVEHPREKPAQINLELLTNEQKTQIYLLTLEMNKIFQKFAYRLIKNDPYGSEDSDKYCNELKKIYSSIMRFPFSVKREDALDRIANFVYSNIHCSVKEVVKYTGIQLEESEWIKLHKANNSGLTAEALAWFENNKTNYTKSKELLLEGLRDNPNDLKLYSSLFLVNNNSKMDDREVLSLNEARKLQQDYCKKAVELKQWDHIYYLTDSMQIMPCALGESNEWWDYDKNRQIQCKCKEAMQLVVKHWPDEYIERAIYEHLNPHVERPKDEEVYAQEIKDYRKELFGVAHKYFDRPLSQ